MRTTGRPRNDLANDPIGALMLRLALPSVIA